MSRLVYKTAAKPLPPIAKIGVQEYIFTGESINAVASELYVDGVDGKVVCLEPNTVGFIEITLIQSLTNSTNGTFVSSSYQQVVLRYQVSSSGIIGLSAGAPTFGAPSTPTTPSAIPTGRLLSSLVTVANRSASNYYPYITLQVTGSSGTNNWLAVMKVHTLPIKGG